MGIMAVLTFHMHGKQQRFFCGVMFQVVSVNIVNIGLGQLHGYVGGSHVPVVTIQAIILLGEAVQQALRIPGIMRTVAVLTGILGYVRVVGVGPGIIPTAVPGRSGRGMCGKRPVIAVVTAETELRILVGQQEKIIVFY